MKTRLKQLARPASSAGLTLIECLVAIVVIVATVAVTTPVIVLAVATRVQSQRAEQAFQLAQAEIDRLRLQTERGGSDPVNVVSAPGTASVADLESVTAPTDGEETLAEPASTTLYRAKMVSVGGNEFGVQVFRTPGSTAASGNLVSYDLGVRVYRGDTVRNNPAALSTTGASLALTSGEGQSTRPLAAIYTSIAQGDRTDSLCYYYDTIDPTASAPANCN